MIFQNSNGVRLHGKAKGRVGLRIRMRKYDGIKKGGRGREVRSTEDQTTQSRTY